MLIFTSKEFKTTTIYKNRLLDKKQLEESLSLPEYGSDKFSFLTSNI